MKRLVTLILLLLLSARPAAAIDLSFTNFGASSLAGTVANNAASLMVDSGAGVLFPAYGNFRAVLYSKSCQAPSSCSQKEIVTLTRVSGDEFTLVSRANEGTTTPASWPAGTKVSHTVTAEWLTGVNTPVYNVKAAGGGLTGAGKVNFHISMGASSNIVTLASFTDVNVFTSADAGKSILVSGSDGSDIQDLWAVISSVTNSTHAVISVSAPSSGLSYANAYWWTTGHDDGPAIQAGLNSAARVYMPAGVYIVTPSSTPLTYSPQLKEWFGDGINQTVIISSSNDLGSPMVEFIDANYLYVHDFTTRGPGINGIYGGQWSFDLQNQGNVERLTMERVEVQHTCSTSAIYCDTCILGTFSQVKSLLNVGVGFHLYNGVSNGINQYYGITNMSPALVIENSNDTVVNAGAVESSGIGAYIKNSYNTQVNGMDAEAQVHRAPDAPASFPAPTAIAGGSLANGTYYLKYTWARRYTDAAVYLESLPSPESTMVTVDAGHKSIQFTIPACPTDAPNVTRAYVYATQPNGAPGTETYADFWNCNPTPRIVTEAAFEYSSSVPPTVAAVGHGFVVDGGDLNAIRESHSRSLGSASSRHLLATGNTAHLTVENLNIVEDASPPTYDIELKPGVSVNSLTTNATDTRILNNSIERGTWSGLPAANSVPAFTKRVYVSGIGPNRVEMYSDGSRWIAAKPITLLTGTVYATVTTVAETILAQATIPAGLMKASDIIVIEGKASKSGTTETFTLTARLGTAGTTADTSIGAQVILTAANRTASAFSKYMLGNPTTLLNMTQSATLVTPYAGSTSTTTAATISSADSNALILSITGAMNLGTTDNTQITALKATLIQN